MISSPNMNGWNRSLGLATLVAMAGVAVVWACPDFNATSPLGLAVDAGPHIASPRGGPDVAGQWLAPMDWPAIAIHAALLPTGEVLHYSYPDDGTSGSRVITWDSVTGAFTDVNWATDLFCSGLVNLPDGSIYVVGGNNDGCFLQGRFLTQSFNPFSKTWGLVGRMETGRWYPNAVQLGDGSILITSGLNENCTSTDLVELYTPGVGLETLGGSEKSMELFPRTHLLTSGLVAHVGPEEMTSTFDPVSREWTVVDFSGHGYRDSGTSVLIPGRDDEIMIIGGYVSGTSTTSCEKIDFDDLESGWQETTPLNFSRAHANPVTLPDKTVLLVGGGRSGLYGSPRMNPELYDPATETWSVMAAHIHGRMYHSTALLLPDGRVLVAGQDSGQSAYLTEIYEPPYLFRSDRPVIDSAPVEVAYGHDFTIETSDASEIESVALLPVVTQTHSVSTNMRYVGLNIVSASESEMVLSGPMGPTYAPRGYYMLFAVKADGVPSEAKIVRVGDYVPPIGCEGDANADGLVDPLDAGFVQARLGCPVNTGDVECDAADVNVDAVVDPLDLGFVLGRFGECD